MSFPSNARMPYGMTGVPAGVPGITGMTAVPAMSAVPGMARVPGGIYQAEKPAGLYATGPQAYQSLNAGQQSYLAQANVATANPQAAGYYASTPAGYLSATSPTSQQRYMVSPSYPGGTALVSSASMLTGAPGYPLATGANYTLSAQSSLTQGVPVATTSLSSQTQSQYPTYIGSQLGPMQISPSQSPYASAAAAGHPLYPTSPYAGLQVQQAQVQQGQVPAQLAGRVPAGYSAVGPAGYSPATGLPLGYPYSY